MAFVDQGNTGIDPAAEAAAFRIRLAVVQLPEAKRAFVLRPRRWLVERASAWIDLVRCLACDPARLPETVTGLHCVAFACPMLHRPVTLAARGP